VELPSGYNNAWYNGSTNEYIVTDSQLYNPNVEARVRSSYRGVSGRTNTAQR